MIPADGLTHPSVGYLKTAATGGGSEPEDDIPTIDSPASRDAGSNETPLAREMQ